MLFLIGLISCAICSPLYHNIETREYSITTMSPPIGHRGILSANGILREVDDQKHHQQETHQQIVDPLVLRPKFLQSGLNQDEAIGPEVSTEMLANNQIPASYVDSHQANIGRKVAIEKDIRKSFENENGTQNRSQKGDHQAVDPGDHIYMKQDVIRIYEATHIPATSTPETFPVQSDDFPTEGEYTRTFEEPESGLYSTNTVPQTSSMSSSTIEPTEPPIPTFLDVMDEELTNSPERAEETTTLPPEKELADDISWIEDKTRSEISMEEDIEDVLSEDFSTSSTSTAQTRAENVVELHVDGENIRRPVLIVDTPSTASTTVSSEKLNTSSSSTTTTTAKTTTTAAEPCPPSKFHDHIFANDHDRFDGSMGRQHHLSPEIHRGPPGVAGPDGVPPGFSRDDDDGLSIEEEALIRIFVFFVSSIGDVLEQQQTTWQKIISGVQCMMRDCRRALPGRKDEVTIIRETDLIIRRARESYFCTCFGEFF